MMLVDHMIQITGDGSRGLTWRQLQRTKAEGGGAAAGGAESPRSFVSAKESTTEDDMSLQSLDTAPSLREYAPQLIENTGTSDAVVTCNGVHFWNGEFIYNRKERNMRSYFISESLQTRRNVALLMAMLSSFDMGFCNAIAAVASLCTNALLKAMSLNDKLLNQVNLSLFVYY